MKNTVKSGLTAIAIYIALFMPAAGLRADALDDLEKLSRSLEKSLDSLQTVRSSLVKEGASVAAQLAVLAAEELQSPGEHRQAEKLLQQSQSLGERMDAVNRMISDSKNRYESSVERTVAACRAALSDLGAELETAGTGRKSVLLTKMQFLLDKKTAWESRLSSPNSAVAQAPNLELQPWNSPAEIRMKGDVLTDEAGMMRAEIANLEKRLKSLREEREVRKNVAEVSKELALFNENDELLGRQMTASAATDAKNAGITGNSYEVRNTGESAGPGAREVFLPNQRTSPAAAAGSNAADLNDQISILEEYMKLLTVRADSLEQKAAWFYKKAHSPSR
jgi:chromosome segregation ATPase